MGNPPLGGNELRQLPFALNAFLGPLLSYRLHAVQCRPEHSVVGVAAVKRSYFRRCFQIRMVGT